MTKPHIALAAALTAALAVALVATTAAQTMTPPAATPTAAPAATMAKPTSYVEYSKAAFDLAADKKRVLFFHASWCPNCRGADTAINAGLKTIPANVVIFKVNYDKEVAMKKTYGITYQHSFVYVDAKAVSVKKWQGGGLTEILAAVK
jgi:thioredoxin 1